jgi:spermidine synthase
VSEAHRALPEPNSGRFAPALIIFLFFAFFLSGYNCLVYEVIFRRQLLLSLGATHYSLGTVLTVFMTGLGLGSAVFGRAADRTGNPLLLFALLEIGIGLSGFALTSFYPSLDGFYAFLINSLGEGDAPAISLKAAIAGGFLLPPAILMGGTYPLIGKTIVGRGWNAGGILGLLYGVNTLGGVAGSIGVTFWLLGKLGTRRTLIAVSALSVLVGVISALLALRWAPGRHGAGKYTVRDVLGRVALGERFQATRSALSLGAVFITGFAGLSLEVYWTRILAYIIGSHGFAFGITLASFLAGISMGSLILSSFIERARNPIGLLGGLLLSLGVSIAAVSTALYRLRHAVGWLNAAVAGSWSRFISLEMGMVFIILMLPTLILGAAFVVVLSINAQGKTSVGSIAGRVYAFNTLGSILGAFTSGFILIPLAGISNGIKWLTVITAAAGLFLIVFAFNFTKTRVMKGAVPALLAGIIVIASIAALFVSPAREGTWNSALQILADDERLIFYEEASSATVAVRENGKGERMLAINGLDEVPVDVSSLLTFRMLAHLPLLLHPNPKEVMVLSLGGAITTGSVTAYDSVKKIDAVDLCRPVLQAAEFFKPWNHDALRDERLNVIIQDGRNHLLTTRKRYDIITADATHPWSADSWMLYTREFYVLAKNKLAEDGLFCQWVPLHSLSPEDYRCILRTMRSVFPEMSLWYTGSYTIALASAGKLIIEPDKIAERMNDVTVKEDLASVGVDSPESLLGLFLFSAEGIDMFTDNGPLNTDDLAYLEHSAARCYGRETTPENLSSLLRFRQSPGNALKLAGRVEHLDEFFSARDKFMKGRIATYEGNFERAMRYYEYALSIAPDDRVSEMFLTDIKRTIGAQRAVWGNNLRMDGKLDEALSAYASALNIDSGEPWAHNGMGLILLSRGRPVEALRHFDEALARRGRDPEIREGRAAALEALGKILDAEKEREEITFLRQGMPRK